MHHTKEQRPSVWIHLEELEALGLPFRVLERNGDLVRAELTEQEVPEEWFRELTNSL